MTTTLLIMTATQKRHIISKLACFNNLGLTSGTYSFNRNGGLFAEIKGAGFLQVNTVFIPANA
jgi:excinuclease UvrABC ATPase subunit